MQQSALQDQPLLLEDLLEQEKREQEKQQAAAAGANVLLSDADFERLRADYLDTVASPPAPVGVGQPPSGRHMGVPPGPQQTLPGQHRLLGPSGENQGTIFDFFLFLSCVDKFIVLIENRGCDVINKWRADVNL